jgi:hypothetical protein
MVGSGCNPGLAIYLLLGGRWGFVSLSFMKLSARCVHSRVLLQIFLLVALVEVTAIPVAIFP